MEFVIITVPRRLKKKLRAVFGTTQPRMLLIRIDRSDEVRRPASLELSLPAHLKKEECVREPPPFVVFPRGVHNRLERRLRRRYERKGVRVITA